MNTYLVEPYSSSRKGNDCHNSGGDELGEQFNCDKCSQSVEDAIQCERCDHWYCCKCTDLPSSVTETILLYKQLHWLCEAYDKAATDTIVVSTAKQSDSTLMCKEDVKEIVTQVGEAIREANERIRKTLVETLQGTMCSGSGVDVEMEADNESNTRLLKVTLNSERDKALLLHNCKKLRNQENPEKNIRSVYITPDLTLREQQKGKSLRVQLAEMNKDGKKFWIKKTAGLCREWGMGMSGS